MSVQQSSKRTVIVGYDGSPASRLAVQYAIGQAGDGHLVIVHAFRVPPEYVGAPYYERAMALATDHARSLLDDLAATCDELHGVDYETDVLVGHAGEVLCRVADQRHANEIVVGTRGVGLVRGLLGSVAHDVLHRAHCPVLVIPAGVTASAAEDGAGPAAVARV